MNAILHLRPEIRLGNTGQSVDSVRNEKPLFDPKFSAEGGSLLAVARAG